MNQNTVLWTLVLFLGASVMFGAIRKATEDEGSGVALAAQAAAGLLLIGAIVVYMRRRR